MISAVAIDIDGTLVTIDGTIPDRNRAALEETARRGTLLVLATARSVAGATEILGDLRLDGALVAELGATVVDFGGSIIAAHRFGSLDAIGIVSDLVDAALHFICTADGINYESSDSIEARTGIGRKLDSSTVDYSQVSRIVVRGAPLLHVQASLRRRPVAMYVGAVAPGGAQDVILVPEGVSKGSGLAFLCERHGIDRSNVLAIGDSSTDVELLEWAGRSVVVADGDPSLRAKASWIAPPAANAGVADALLHFSVVGPLPRDRT